MKEDNQGAIHWAKKNVTTPNGKHVDVRRHFLRKRVARVSSALQHANFFTKLLHTEAFRFHRNFVMNLWSFLHFTILTFLPGIGVLGD